jgi:hypothetical protein
VTDTSTAAAAQLKKGVDSLVQRKDNIETWQYQLISMRSEIEALKQAQETFKRGIGLLRGAKLLEEIGGAELADLEGEVNRNIAATVAILRDIKVQHDAAQRVQAEIVKWDSKAKLQEALGNLPKDGEVAEVQRIQDLVKDFAANFKLFADTQKKVATIDAAADAVQSALVKAVQHLIEEASGRLETAEHGAVYDAIHSAVGGLFGVLALFEPLALGPALIAAKTAAQELTNAVQEAEVQIRILGKRGNLDEALKGMTPFGVYRANLIKLEAAFQAAFDAGQLVGIAPVVGVYLAALVSVVGGFVKGYFDGRVKVVEKREEMLSEEMQKLGPRPAQSAVDKLRKDANTYVKKDWTAMKRGLEQLNPQKNPADFLGMLADKGSTVAAAVVSGDKGQITAAVLEPLIEKLGEAFMSATGHVPEEAPDAIFDFEIKLVLAGDIKALNAPFTHGEQAEMLYDVAAQKQETPPASLAEVYRKWPPKDQLATPAVPVLSDKQKHPAAIGSTAPRPIFPVVVEEQGAFVNGIDDKTMTHTFKSKNRFWPTDDVLNVYPTYVMVDVSFVKQDKSKQVIGKAVTDLTLNFDMQSLSAPGRIVFDPLQVKWDPATTTIQVVLEYTYMYMRVDLYKVVVTWTIPASGKCTLKETKTKV